MPRANPPDPSKQHPPKADAPWRRWTLDAGDDPDTAAVRKAQSSAPLGRADNCICDPYPCTAADWLTCKRCTCEGRCQVGRKLHCKACKVAGPLFTDQDLKYIREGV